MPASQDDDRPDVTFDRSGTARESADPALLKRVLRVVGVIALFVFGAMAVLFAADVFLLAFFGILIAVLLRTPADWLSARTGLAPGWMLAVVGLAIVALIAGFGMFIVPRLLEQLREFLELLPAAVEALDTLLGAGMDLEAMLPAAQAVLGRLPGIVTTTFGAIAAVFVVIAVGVYLAGHPEIYVNGLVRLFPIHRRRRARELLGEIGYILQRWLAGQLLAMVAVGTLTYIGLTILGVPLALGLAVLTGLLEFIPYIGPVAAAIPAILWALSQDTTLALWVLGLYLVVQGAESWLITPLVQHRAVYLPPALLIVFQITMGVLFGFLGILLATPLAAVAMVAVKRLYVEGVLGDEVERES